MYLGIDAASAIVRSAGPMVRLEEVELRRGEFPVASLFTEVTLGACVCVCVFVRGAHTQSAPSLAQTPW